MKLINFTKKRVVALGLAGGMAAGAGGIAAAYFTAAGSGTGHGTAGSPASLIVQEVSSVGSINPGAAYPQQTVKFLVTNPGKGNQKLGSVTTPTSSHPQLVTVSTSTTGSATNGQLVIVTYRNGSPVAGCLASWFTTFVTYLSTSNVTPNTGLGATTIVAGVLKPGGHTIAHVIVTMITSNTTQNKCAGAEPKLKLTFTG